MRKIANNVFFKIILGGLVLIFIVIGGIENQFLKGKKDIMATINGQTAVNYREFSNAQKRELQKWQSVFGKELSDDMVKELGKRILSSMINNKLLETEADNLGIKIADITVIDYIKSDQRFSDEQKKFDKKKFQNILANNNINEQEYIRVLKRDIATKFLFNSIASQKISATSLEAFQYSSQHEQRIADVVTINANLLNKPTNVPLEEIKKYYAEHSKEFLIPEQRSGKYLSFTNTDFFKDIQISDAEVSKEYDENIADFVSPELRDIYNLVLPNETKAQEALKLIANGKEFSEVIRILTEKPVEDSLIVGIKKNDLPDSLKTAIFELQPGKVSDIVQSPLGYHLIQLLKVTPTSTFPLHAVQGEIKERLIRKKAEEKLIVLHKQIDDELASGATIEEIANKFSLKLQSFQNIHKDTAYTPPFPNFVDTVFATESGYESPLTQIQGITGYFVVKVEQVSSPKEKEFEEVKQEISEILTNLYQHNEAKKIAQEAHKALSEGKNLADIANLYPIEIQYGQNFSLIEADTKWPQDMIKAIFQLKKNIPSDPIYDNKNLYIIGIVRDIIPVSLTADKPDYHEFKKEFTQQISNNVLEEYLRYLHKKHKVKIYAENI
jgi:peptidyl-prolyl cis-trans isomerase D